MEMTFQISGGGRRMGPMFEPERKDLRFIDVRLRYVAHGEKHEELFRLNLGTP